MLYVNYLLKYKINVFKHIKVINISSNYDYIKQNMSNIFKSNSRFFALVDDTPQQKNNSKKDKEQKRVNEDSKEDRFNSFKSERHIRNECRFRSFNEREREQYRLEREEEIKAQKELEQREKDRIAKESLKIENFPDLIVIPKKKTAENNMDDTKISYIEKLKKEDIVENYSDPDLENLKPGWVLLKRDPVTRQTIFKHHPKTLIEEKEKEEKTDQEIMMDIVKALSELHEKRTQEYIENYGYDEWERMFKFPDWREHEAWLQEIEEMENQTDESEYEEEDEEY